MTRQNETDTKGEVSIRAANSWVLARRKKDDVAVAVPNGDECGQRRNNMKLSEG